ncbi:MAG: hypothetical protein V9G12_10945 [Microthrixaceae bacterium]
MTNTSSYRSQFAGQLRVAAAPVRTLLGDLSPADVPLPFAVDILDAFIELERLAASGRVLIAARAAEADAWRRDGCPSAAAWLALRQGTDTGRARADLATSEQLGALPDTADAVRNGELSPQQAGAVAAGASANPAAENDLLETAKSDSLRHTKEEAARRRAEVEAEESKVERERKVRAGRKAYWWSKGGRWCLYAEGPLAEGAALEQALENRIGEIHRDRRHGQREGREQYAYDALIDLTTGANGSTEPGDTSDADTDAGGTDDSVRRSGQGGSSGRGSRRRESVRRLMLVRVDLAALVNGAVGDGDVCEIPGIGPVSVEQARTMFGDSILRLVTTNGTAVIDVVNPARKPTEAQRIAKLWTDPKCCVAGCNRTVDLEYEHREDYARTQHTVLVESEHMCTFHHQLKTLENWQLVAGTGRRAFVDPDDPRHPHHTPDPPESPTRAPEPPGRPRAAPASPELRARYDAAHRAARRAE